MDDGIPLGTMASQSTSTRSRSVQEVGQRTPTMRSDVEIKALYGSQCAWPVISTFGACAGINTCVARSEVILIPLLNDN
jgi:hypothetical protein